MMYNKETYNNLVALIMSGDIDLVFELSKSVNLTVLKKLTEFFNSYSSFICTYPYDTNTFMNRLLLWDMHRSKLKKIYNNRINEIKKRKYLKSKKWKK